MSGVKPPSTDTSNPGAGDDEEPDLPTGTMVGEYSIERRIGSGGMGMVYAARHPVIGKRVAIKVLKADVCNDAIAIERFIDEARVVNQIEHPNIVDIFAFGQLPNGRHYFVMEWLRGVSLRDRIERGALLFATTIEILLPLVRALAAAHESGVVHRDLKPDNVFIVEARDGKLIKLLDFGVAKLSKADLRSKRVGHTATGTIVGTPQYLSPEQAKGHAIDHRADIYALGAIAYEALTGTPPFVAPSVMEVVAMHLMEAPPRPSAAVPSVPFELDELVVASLAKEPDARPTLNEWREVLERLADQCEIDTRPRAARTLATTEPFEDTPLPGALPARPRAATGPSQQVAHGPPTPLPFPTPPSPAAPHHPARWRVIALVAVPIITVGVWILATQQKHAGPAPAPPPTELVATPKVDQPPTPVQPASPLPPTTAPPLPPATTAIVHTTDDTAPAIAHHHHRTGVVQAGSAVVEATALGSATGSANGNATSDDDLLPPGSIPLPGSGSAAP